MHVPSGLVGGTLFRKLLHWNATENPCKSCRCARRAQVEDPTNNNAAGHSANCTQTERFCASISIVLSLFAFDRRRWTATANFVVRAGPRNDTAEHWPANEDLIDNGAWTVQTRPEQIIYDLLFHANCDDGEDIRRSLFAKLLRVAAEQGRPLITGCIAC